MKYTVSRLLRYLGTQKLAFAAAGFLVFVSVSAELLGTYMIRPVVNGLVEGGSLEHLLRTVLLTALIYLTGVAASLGYTQIMARTAQKVVYEIRRDLFCHMETLPLKFFDTRRHGDVMSVFTNDVDTISDAMNNSFAAIIKSFMQIFGTMILIFILSWRLSLIVAIAYIAMYLYIRFSGKRSKKFYNEQQSKLGDLDGFIQEMVSGQKVVKVFCHEEENIRGFAERNEHLRVSGTAAQAYAATMVPAVVSISYLNYAIVALAGGLMAVMGLTDPGSLSSYLVFVRQSAAPINHFTNQTNFLLSALAGAERIFTMMDEKSEVDEGDVTLGKDESGWIWQKSDGSHVPLRGDVRFEDVSFGYAPGHSVLSSVSLYAKPGQMIAFVGSTGAGKTTITNLINRFYDVDEGRVIYDGIDVRSIRKADLRRSLGMVLQVGGHTQAVFAVPGHAQGQGLHPHAQQPGVHGGGGGAEVPHELGGGLGDVGPLQAELLGVDHPVVALVGGGEAGELVGVGVPVEFPRVHDGPAHCVGVAVHVLGGGVGDDVRPPFEGPAVHRGGEGVVHNQGHTVGMGGPGKLLDVQHGEGGVGDGLPEHRPGLGPEGGLQLRLRAVGIHEGEVDAHPLHGDGEEVEGSAVDGGGAYHVLPAGDDVEDGKEGSRLPRGGEHGRRAPLQGADLGGHVVVGGVLEAGVEVAAGL